MKSATPPLRSSGSWQDAPCRGCQRRRLPPAAPSIALNRTSQPLSLPRPSGAQLLGLEDATLLLGPQIEAAYDDLLNTPLEEGYRWGSPAACSSRRVLA